MVPVSVDSLALFAALSAQLSDPFADRGAVLGAVGLDAARFRQLEEHWMRRFAEEGGERMADSFAVSFAEKRRELATPVGGATEADIAPCCGPCFLSAQPQPWRAEAARVGLDTPAEPFQARPSPPPPAVPSALGGALARVAASPPPSAVPSALGGALALAAASLQAPRPFTGTLDPHEGPPLPVLPFTTP
jgi:hypothetical protein